MPPSGYSLEQAQTIVEFLRSCAKALEDECLSHRIAPLGGLRKEVNQIRQELCGKSVDVTVKGILELTVAFYERLACLEPETFEDFWNCVDQALEETRLQVLAIHIDPSVSI